MLLRREAHIIRENESHVTKQDILMLMPLQYVTILILYKASISACVHRFWLRAPRPGNSRVCENALGSVGYFYLRGQTTKRREYVRTYLHTSSVRSLLVSQLPGDNLNQDHLKELIRL